MPRYAFVDCHSHAVPARDDGAQSADEGLWLCRDAAGHGTAVLFATPHVWPSLPLTAERQVWIEASFEEVRRLAPLELRLGYELTPAAALLREDLRRYALEGTDVVLIEVPFGGPIDTLLEVVERIEEQGLRAAIAHPERSESVQDDPSLLDLIAAPGRLLQVNATSLLGRHGVLAEDLALELIESGRASLVASDGHRPTRPARLDEAFAIASERVGEVAALPLFDGSALGLSAKSPPVPSRIGSSTA
jgi:protein-tyrosine phosphatase